MEIKTNTSSMDFRQFLGLSTSCFAQGLGISMVATFIGIYSGIFELTGVQVGLVTMVFSLTQLLVLIPLGRYADLGRRKYALLVGLLIGIPTYLLFLFATDFKSLLLARMFQGIAYPMAAISALSFVSLRSPEIKRGRYIGLFNTLKSVGRTTGALAGGFLVGRFGFGVPYGSLVVLYGLGFILIYFFLPQEKETQSEGPGLDLKELVSSARLRIQIAFESAFAFAKAIVIVFIPVYAFVVLGVSEGKLGAIVAARYIPMIVGQWFTGRLSDRIGRSPLIITGGLLFSVSALLIPFQKQFIGLVVISLTLGLADTIRVPASWAVFADEGIDAGPATALSMRMLAWRPGVLIGPVLGGLAKDLINIKVTFLLASSAVVVALVTYIYLRGRFITE